MLSLISYKSIKSERYFLWKQKYDISITDGVDNNNIHYNFFFAFDDLKASFIIVEIWFCSWNQYPLKSIANAVYILDFNHIWFVVWFNLI